jgi:hypothetical protein
VLILLPRPSGRGQVKQSGDRILTNHEPTQRDRHSRHRIHRDVDGHGPAVGIIPSYGRDGGEAEQPDAAATSIIGYLGKHT